MWKSFPKILQPMHFLPFYFLSAIHWCRWEEKYSCFPLDSLGPPLSLSRRAEEIAEETRTSSDTAYTARAQRCFKCYVAEKLLLSVWQADFSSKSYKLGYSGLQIPLLGKLRFDGEVWHKAGTAPFQYLLPRRCGAERAQGEKGWWCRAAQGGAAKQVSLGHGDLPQLHAVAAITMQDTRQLRSTSACHGAAGGPQYCAANGSGMCWPGKEVRDRGMSLPQNQLQDVPVSRESMLSSSGRVQQTISLILHATLAPWNWG